MNKRLDNSVLVRATSFITFGIGLLVFGYILSLATGEKAMVSSAFLGGAGIITICSSFLWWCKKQRP